MPMWRCPHCGTPQPEMARCWVCQRSTTACVTCRHFRRSVAASIGYCGLDRRRLPLNGDEIRSCWEAGQPSGAPTIAAATPLHPMPLPRDFVEVTPVRRVTSAGAEAVDDPAPVARTVEPRWSLWDDPALT